jgi:hypothetical protein
MTHKIRNFIFLSAGCSLLRDEDFFCSLDFFNGGQRIGILQSLIKKIFTFFFCCNFFQVLVMKTQDPERYSAYNAGSGSGSNDYGSATLKFYNQFKNLSKDGRETDHYNNRTPPMCCGISDSSVRWF